MEWIYLVLIAVVIVFGIGVLVWNRRRAARDLQTPAAPPPAGIERPPQPTGTTAVLEAEPEAEPEVEVAVVEAPTFRGRLARARAAMATAFAGVLGRAGITDATWDDLEEALLRADVGLGVTTDLLDGLRSSVKAKELTEPDQLLDALRAEMKSRLSGADRPAIR